LVATVVLGVAGQEATAAGNCTTASFRAPSWFIQDFQTYPDLNKTTNIASASFSLLNRATGLEAIVNCTDAQAPWANGTWSRCEAKVLNGGFAQVWALVTPQESTIRVNETWGCDDREPHQAFTAAGNTTFLITCTEIDGCIQTDPIALIRGSLSSPVAITPAWSRGTPGHYKPGCAFAAWSPSWELTKIEYLNRTEDGGGSNLAGARQLNFTLFNPVIGYQVGCLVHLSPGNDNAPAQFSCSNTSDPRPNSRYHIDTDVRFEPANFGININQTWFCDDVDEARPVRIQATGGMVMNLECNVVHSPGSGSGPASTTQECTGVRFTMYGSPMSQTVLPPYSIEDPLLTPDGCTASSIMSPSWGFSNFRIESRPSNSTETSSTVSFDMVLETQDNEFLHSVAVSRPNITLGTMQDSWYPCTFAQGEAPVAPRNCSFRYRPSTNTLDVDAEWTCNDLDSKHPILFRGASQSTLPPAQCTTNSRGTSCSLGEGYRWTSPISNATW
ncbi:hypothetical protein GQ53DRAFT_603414, partial [Thozetella sp. PMI_491]